MSDSILTSTKKMCGIVEEYTVFDSDFLVHINTVFSTLNQLGIGPLDGFMIEDANTLWSDYIIDARLMSVKSYMYLRVRVLFDPPATSFAIQSMADQIKEMEWRLEIATIPVIPAAPISVPDDDGSIYDGGSPDSGDDGTIYDGGTP